MGGHGNLRDWVEGQMEGTVLRGDWKGVFVELGRSLVRGKFPPVYKAPAKTPGSRGYNSLNWPFPVTGLVTAPIV